MKRKLDNQKGETLVETLVSILIFTMASIILYTMVTSAVNVTKTTKQKDKEVRNQLAIVEPADPSTKSGSAQVTMTLVPKAGTVINVGTIQVDTFSNADDQSLFSYFEEVPETTAAEGSGGI